MDEKTMIYNIIVGTRPNFVKLSAFMREAENHKEHTFKVIHTGQHYDDLMSKIFFEDLGLSKPDVFLENGSLEKMIFKIKKVIGNYPVIVFGDTRSALAGALASLGNKLIHIEAGLRSYDNRMPEEVNRITIDHLSHLLFTSESSANKNLLDEGFTLDRINYVGNLMIETLENFMPVISKSGKGNHIIATVHRAENEIYLKRILEVLSQIPQLILVLHPGTLEKIKNYGINFDKISTIPSMGYIEFMKLVYSSIGVITDSGGIQEEADYLGIPCATIRDNTERPSTLLGSNKLFPINSLNSEDIISHLNKNNFNHVSDFPDNRVAKRIFKYL